MKKFYIIFLALSCAISACKKEYSQHVSDHSISEPELFLPGIVSTQHMEFGMTISPTDSKTIFFTRRIGEQKQKIYETSFIEGVWSTPTIAPFSTDRDESPHFTPDGNTIYFGSQRPIEGRPNKGNFDMNVWKTTLENGQWSEPVPLSEELNQVQKENEQWPVANMSDLVTSDNKTFYTGTFRRGEKGIDLYQTTLKNDEFSAFEKLPKEICTDDKWEYAPMISPDGNYLFFQVYARKDGLGGDDIFVSKKQADGSWSASVNLGSLINTKMNEAPCAMTSDGKYFFFGRDEKEDPEQYDGIPSIYIIETSALKLDTLF